MTPPSDTSPAPSSKGLFKSRPVRLAAIGIGIAMLVAGVYGIEAFRRNAGIDPLCRPAAQLAARLAPLARGELAAIAPAQSPLRVTQLSFKDAEGQTVNLAQWKGRVVLLNLWATWCVPCRREMPALDALEQKLGGPDFQVVAVNIDTRDLDKPKNWLQDAKVTKLAYFADPTARIFQELKAAGRAFGMPTTLLIDRAGCEIATLAGPAEWASGDATAFVQAALKR